MGTRIQKTVFGKIKIDGKWYENDVIIKVDGKVKKRGKRLSKEVYGTSHKVSFKEAKYLYQEGTENVVIGSGQYGALEISKEAASYFEEMGCKVETLKTPSAIERWNQLRGGKVGLFHVTC